jgi:hypothetical protein
MIIVLSDVLAIESVAIGVEPPPVVSPSGALTGADCELFPPQPVRRNSEKIKTPNCIKNPLLYILATFIIKIYTNLKLYKIL